MHKTASFKARGETLTTTRSFKDAFAKRRSLIPADGWYEGKKKDDTKIRLTERTEEWFCLAGLWDRAETQDGLVGSYTVVTQAPRPAFRPYNRWVPVVLRPEEWQT